MCWNGPTIFWSRPPTALPIPLRGKRREPASAHCVDVKHQANTKNMNTNDTNEKTRQPAPRRVPFTFKVLLFGCLIYVFSIGPVLCVADRLGLGGTRYVPALRGLYGPVFFAARSSACGAKFYESYMNTWSQIISSKNVLINTDVRNSPPMTPIGDVLASVDGITNGQSSFELFVPMDLITHDGMAMSQIIKKAHDHGLLPAGFEERPTGRLYSFQAVRSWEAKN